jgi:hypothetical protein
VYDGANRALKVSRASVALFASARALVATGLPDGLCAGRVEAVIGRDDGKGFWMGQGVHRGTWTNHRVSNPATGSGIHWEKKIISASGKSAPRLLLKRLAPPKAAIVARRTRGYQSLLCRDL